MHYYLYTLYRYHNMYRQCACVPVVLYYFTVRYHRQYIYMYGYVAILYYNHIILLLLYRNYYYVRIYYCKHIYQERDSERERQCRSRMSVAAPLEQWCQHLCIPITPGAPRGSVGNVLWQ